MPPVFNFKTIRPATEVGYLGSFISIPEFSYIGPIWKGVSEQVLQYNYSADRNFVLKARPVPPSGVNFVAVIRYRVGLITYRYKLWESVGEILSEPLYRGQVIKKNFVIEIWNTANSNSVESDGFDVELGMRSLPAINYSNLADIETDLSEFLTPENLIASALSLPTTGLLARYTANGYVAPGNLEDQYGSFDLTVTGGPALGGTYVNPNSSNGQYFPIALDSASFFNGASPFAGASGVRYVVALVAQWNWLAADILFGTMPLGVNAVQVRQRTGSPQIACATGAGPSYGSAFEALAIGDWGVLVFKIDPSATSYIGLGNNDNTGVVGAGTIHAANFQIGPSQIFLAELLVFNASTVLTEAVDYLLNSNGFGDPIPTEMSGDGAWLDNE